MTNHCKPRYARRPAVKWTPLTTELACWLRRVEGWEWESIADYFDCEPSPVKQVIQRNWRKFA